MLPSAVCFHEPSRLWTWSPSAGFYLPGNNTGLLKWHTSVARWFHGRVCLIQQQFISLPSEDSVVPLTNCSPSSHRGLGTPKPSERAALSMASGFHQMFPQRTPIMSSLLQLPGQCNAVCPQTNKNAGSSLRHKILLQTCHFSTLNWLSVSCWVRCFLTSAFAAPRQPIRGIAPAHVWRQTKIATQFFSLHSTTIDMAAGGIFAPDTESTLDDGTDRVINLLYSTSS